MDRVERLFDSRYVPQRPPVVLPDEEHIEKFCLRCKRQFTAHSRSAKRCAPCQAIVNADRTKRNTEKRRRRRLALRRGDLL